MISLFSCKYNVFVDIPQIYQLDISKITVGQNVKLKLRFFDLYNVQLILFNHTLIKPIETSLQAGLCLAIPHHQSLWKNIHILLLENVINSVCLTGCGFLRQYLLLQAKINYCFIHFTVCIKFKKWNNNIYANSTICHA